LRRDPTKSERGAEGDGGSVRHGFTLHAATRADTSDASGREALLRYVLRPPIAQDKIEQGQDGLVRILPERPFPDGTVAVELDPLSLLCRLAASVPPPRHHTVRKPESSGRRANGGRASCRHRRSARTRTGRKQEAQEPITHRGHAPVERRFVERGLTSAKARRYTARGCAGRRRSAKRVEPACARHHTSPSFCPRIADHGRQMKEGA